MILSTSNRTNVNIHTQKNELNGFFQGCTIATVKHFRHVPTHNFSPKIVLLMKNDKQHNYIF